MSLGFLVAAASRRNEGNDRTRMGDDMEMRRRRDSRGRYMEDDDDRRMGNDHSTYMGYYPRMGDDPEMRRRRDDRGRYMEDDEGAEMAYRPWPEPHIPPYLDRPDMTEGNIRPGRERRMEDEPYRMRDRNIISIRDYQDRRRIGFGENRMHYGGEEHMDKHRMGDAYHMGAYPMTEKLTMEEAAEWVEGMKNTDPDHPTGEKWTMEQIKPIATKHGFTTPDKQIEFWAVMNMMYSDYCETAKKHGVSTMDFYADMAKAWMHDKDAVENKTAAYIEYCTK